MVNFSLEVLEIHHRDHYINFHLHYIKSWKLMNLQFISWSAFLEYYNFNSKNINLSTSFLVDIGYP